MSRQCWKTVPGGLRKGSDDNSAVLLRSRRSECGAQSGACSYTPRASLSKTVDGKTRERWKYRGDSNQVQSFGLYPNTALPGDDMSSVNGGEELKWKDVKVPIWPVGNFERGSGSTN